MKGMLIIEYNRRHMQHSIGHGPIANWHEIRVSHSNTHTHTHDHMIIMIDRDILCKKLIHEN